MMLILAKDARRDLKWFIEEKATKNILLDFLQQTGQRLDVDS